MQRGTGEWHFGWVLDGRAVQDVFIVPARSDTGQPREWGSSLRSFDPKTGTWFIAWIGPVQGTLQTFTAWQQGDEIVHEGVGADGRPSRWVFSEIKPDSFRWRSLISPIAVRAGLWCKRSSRHGGSDERRRRHPRLLSRHHHRLSGNAVRRSCSSACKAGKLIRRVRGAALRDLETVSSMPASTNGTT